MGAGAGAGVAGQDLVIKGDISREGLLSCHMQHYEPKLEEDGCNHLEDVNSPPESERLSLPQPAIPVPAIEDPVPPGARHRGHGALDVLYLQGGRG